MTLPLSAQGAIDWTRYMEGLQGKVNLDANNFSAVGRSTVSKFAFPTNKYIDLSLGSIGSEYVAPANGWYILAKRANKQSEWYQLSCKETGLAVGADGRASGAWGAIIPLPVSKGNIVKYEGTSSGATVTFRFIYAEGSK